MVEPVQAAGSVNALNASDRVLQCFWDLAALEEEKRLTAAQQLVQDVLADQQQHPPAPQAAAAAGAQVAKGKQLEHALRKCSPVMTYALRRLAKGVGSGRAAARQGFATALTALLAAGQSGEQSGDAPLLTFEDANVLMESCLDSMGGGKGGEIRDALLGRVFGLGAIVRAGLVKDATTASQIITSMLQLATKKAFLREAAVALIIELLTGGPLGPGAEAGQAGSAASTDAAAAGNGKGKKRKSGASEAAAPAPANNNRWLPDAVVCKLLGTGAGSCEPLRKFMCVPAASATAEVLLLALCLWPYMPQELVALTPLPDTCPAPPLTWATQPQSVPTAQVAPAAAALFSPAYLHKILPALQSTTSSAPRIHVLWFHLLSFLLPGITPHQRKVGDVEGAESATTVNADQLTNFWNIVVEEGLFSSSHERKYLGCQLFLVMLPRLPASAVDVLFSRNFCHTLAVTLKKNDAYLHAMSKKAMDRVSQFLAKSPDAASKLSVSAALSRLGGLGFQQQAAAKSTAGLLDGMDEQGVLKYCQQYMTAFLQGTETGDSDGKAHSKPAKKSAGSDDEEEEDEEEESGQADRALDKRRSIAIEQLVASLKFPAATDAVRATVLRFLAACSFFSPGPSAAPTPSKKGKTSAGKLPEEVSAMADALKAGAPAVSDKTRMLCAQRLLAVVAHMPASPASKPAADSDQEEPVKKKRKGQAAAPQGPERDPARLLEATCQFVKQVQGSTGVQLAAGSLPDAADVALTVLREMEDALEAGVKRHGTAKSSAHARAASLLHLVQLLQLYLLGDVAAAFDTSLIYDLRRIAKESGAAELPDLDEQAVNEDDEEMEEAGKSDGSDAEERAGGPSWSEVLLDVLLSLLSRPSAPLPSAALRTACEAVWRASCDAVSPAGLQDLLRVVAAGGKPGAGDEDDEDVLEGGSDEEEEEVEMEVGSASDDDGDEDDEDDEEEEMEVDNTQPAKKQPSASKASKAAGGDDSGSDDSDVESDPADDAEMFKMDTKIAAYMRAVADQKRGAKEAAAALAALRFRALSLLEMFARKASNSPLLLLTLLPLVRSLATASKLGPTGNQALAQRVAALLEKHICKAKPSYDPEVLPVGQVSRQQDSTGVEQQAAGMTLSTLLNRLLFMTARAETKPVNVAAGSALSVALRAAASAEDCPDAHRIAEEAYTSVLEDFFHKKKSRLSLATVEACAVRAPQLGVAAGPLVLLLKEAGGGARNAFKQVEAVQLLLATLRAASSRESPVDLEQLATQLKPHATALGGVLESVAGGVHMKPAHHADACKACVGIAEVLKRLVPTGRKLGELIGLRGVTKSICAVQAVGVPDRVASQLGRLAQVLGLSDSLTGATADPVLKAKLLKAKQQQPGAAGEKKKQGKESKAGAK